MSANCHPIAANETKKTGSINAHIAISPHDELNEYPKKILPQTLRSNSFHVTRCR